MEGKRQTCLKLHFPNTNTDAAEAIFVKGTWYDAHFHLSITDGFNAWLCHASEEEVKERATQWDQPVTDYVRLAERYLGFQQPHSVYAFADAADGHKRLSWTFEKEGTKLQWRWKCQQSPDSKKTTAEILDFLMDANITLSEEVVRKTESFDRIKEEAEKCLSQSERLANEKVEFESEIYDKFLEVLNSKKSKLRELRDQISKVEAAEKSPQEHDTDKTESFDGESDEEDATFSSKDVSTTKPSQSNRKRTTQK